MNIHAHVQILTLKLTLFWENKKTPPVSATIFNKSFPWCDAAERNSHKYTVRNTIERIHTSRSVMQLDECTFGNLRRHTLRHVWRSRSNSTLNYVALLFKCHEFVTRCKLQQ